MKNIFCRDNLRNLILMPILAVVFLLPYLGVVYYALPHDDDFAAAFSISVYGGYSLKHLIDVAIHYYLTWEGNYTGQFLFVAINPIIIGNTDSTVIAFNIIGFIVFVIAMYCIMRVLLGLFIIKRSDASLVAFIATILCMNCRFLSEMLAWFTGYVYYTLPILCGLIGLCICIYIYIYKSEMSDCRKGWLTVLACMLTMLGCGGSLQISGLICWINLLLLAWAFLGKKKYRYALSLFLTSFVFSVVNVLAPGYWMRKTDYESVSIITGVIYTIKCVLMEIKVFIFDTYAMIALVAIFIVLFLGIKEGKKGIFLHPVTVIISGLLAMLISSLPVCYGYGSAEMARRGYEILDIVISVWSVLFVVAIVNWLKVKNINSERLVYGLVGGIAVVMLLIYVRGKVLPKDVPSMECAIALADGSIKDYSDTWREVLHTIDRPHDTYELEIEIDGKYLDDEYLIKGCELKEDATYWGNFSAAAYYRYNSIKMVRK